MTGKMITFGTTILVVAAALAGPSLSQIQQRTGPRFGSPEEFRRYIDRRAELREKQRQARKQAMEQERKRVMKQAREQSLKEALQIRDSQWPTLRPKLMKVVDLQDESEVAVEIRDAREVTTTETLRGDRSSSSRPETTTTQSYEDWSYTKSRELETRLTRGQKACDELVALLEAGDATDEQKTEKMNALRRARRDAANELAIAQQELRKVLSLRQEATLVMTGLLN